MESHVLSTNCKKIHIILILFLSVSSVFAQGMKFGIHFDPTIVWLQSDVKNVTPFGSHIGFNFGLLADYYFAENYAFATGVSLFNTGGKLKYEDGISLEGKRGTEVINPGESVMYRIQYVKIPLALKFKTHRIGRVVYSANLGFDPMIRATGRIDHNNNVKIDVKDEIKPFNAGWHFGGGISYSLGGETAIFFGLSYMNTFGNMVESEDYTITSRNLSLNIVLMF